MDARTGLPVVGMIGGGQLARMTHQAAIALGQSLRVLAAAPDDGAALVAVVARSPYGQLAAYPVVQTVQQDGICVEVIAPAPGLVPERGLAAQHLAMRLATELDVVGILAVELFETVDGLLVNELAMR